MDRSPRYSPLCFPEVVVRQLSKSLTVNVSHYAILVGNHKFREEFVIATPNDWRKLLYLPNQLAWAKSTAAHIISKLRLGYRKVKRTVELQKAKKQARLALEYEKEMHTKVQKVEFNLEKTNQQLEDTLKTFNF